METEKEVDEQECQMRCASCKSAAHNQCFTSLEGFKKSQLILPKQEDKKFKRELENGEAKLFYWAGS